MDMREFDNAPEELIVELARQGRVEAYNQLVLRHQPLAYNVAYRMLGDGDAAADAVQDSFLKAYTRLGQYRSVGAPFRSWLMRIVVNTCYDELRKRRRHQAYTIRMDRDDDGGCGDGDGEWLGGARYRGEMPEEYVLRRELSARLQAAIAGLPPDQRTILVLCDVEGLSYEEIAAIAGVPMGTVKSRLARARSRVRNTLQPEAQNDGTAIRGIPGFRDRLPAG